jgi:peptidoglycan L-alanyl-D-glutamate endopeptidase CwlK
MASRLLTDLDIDVQPVSAEWLRQCNARGVSVLIYCTLRTRQEQDKLYAQGRDANGKRIRGKSIVTYAKGGYSAHNFGRAFDAVPWEHFLDKFKLNKLRYTIGDHNIDHDILVKRKLDWTPFDTKQAEKEFRQEFNLFKLDWKWRVMAETALDLGLEWGGMWKSFKDYVHFQYLAGKTIADYRNAA